MDDYQYRTWPVFHIDINFCKLWMSQCIPSKVIEQKLKVWRRHKCHKCRQIHDPHTICAILRRRHKNGGYSKRKEFKNGDYSHRKELKKRSLLLKGKNLLLQLLLKEQILSFNGCSSYEKGGKYFHVRIISLGGVSISLGHCLCMKKFFLLLNSEYCNYSEKFWRVQSYHT